MLQPAVPTRHGLGHHRCSRGPRHETASAPTHGAATAKPGAVGVRRAPAAGGLLRPPVEVMLARAVDRAPGGEGAAGWCAASCSSTWTPARPASGPWANSLPTTQQVRAVAGWSSARRAFSSGQIPTAPGAERSATIGQAPGAFCRATCSQVLALNGPLDAANELSGGHRLRAPIRLIDTRDSGCG